MQNIFTTDDGRPDAGALVGTAGTGHSLPPALGQKIWAERSSEDTDQTDPAPYRAGVCPRSGGVAPQEGFADDQRADEHHGSETGEDSPVVPGELIQRLPAKMKSLSCHVGEAFFVLCLILCHNVPIRR